MIINDLYNNKKQDVAEGRFVKGPGGVPLDRQGRPVAPKAPKAEPMRMRQWVVHHEGQRGEGGEMIIDAPNFETAWELANEYDLDIIDIKPAKGVAEGSKMARADKSAKAPKPEDQQEYDAVEKYRKDLAQSYNKEPNFGIKDDEEENKWWIDYDLDEGVTEGSGPQVGDAVYYGKRLVGWFKGYSEHGKIITEPNYEEMGDEYANRDVYWDPQDKITIKPEQGMAEGSFDHWSPMGKDSIHQDRIRSLQNLIAIAKEQGRQLQVQELELALKKLQGVNEVSLGDYRKKAAVSQAGAKIDRFFGRDDAAKVAAADQTIAKRERGLARADARTKPYTPPPAAPADLEKQQRDLTAKYPNIDELVRRAELNRDPDYEMADGQAYYAARDAEQNYQKLKQIQRVIQGLNESLQRTQP